MQYCMYLRKSRTDAEAEAHGEGETLARHEKILLDTAKRLKLSITEIYKEIVSGETISARPIMQKLLSEVERGLWDGVLVVEVERLARGDTIDQGIVAQTFKFAGTKIITPTKIYDPNNEFDEEYFEFGLFMSRREYKTINRRLQRGREAAAKEGKFVGSIAPFGYKRIKLEKEKGYSLEIDPDKAKIIKLIFDLYVNGDDGKRMGMQQIAHRLNEIGVSPIRHDYWQKETIRDIITNPTYAGKIRWKWRMVKKQMIDGKMAKSRPINYNDDCIIAEGLHDAIIDADTFNRAQKILSECPPPPVGYKNTVKNPLAGLLVCGKCGRKMVLRKANPPKKFDYVVCHARDCKNISTPYHYVEERILNILQGWVDKYNLKLCDSPSIIPEQADILAQSLKTINGEIAILEKQLNSTYDLLEQGIYNTDIFLERSKDITARIENAKKQEKKVNDELVKNQRQLEERNNFIPKVEHLLSVYNSIDSAVIKNQMLKEIISKAIYNKDTRGCFKNTSAEDFNLTVYPALPSNEYLEP